MKRKMVIIGISYILGLFFASFFALAWIWMLALSAGMFFFWLFLLHRFSWQTIVTAAVSFGIGAALYTGYTVTVYEPIVALAGTETRFLGHVHSTVLYHDNLASYTLEGSFQDGTSATILCLTEDYDCQYGDYVEVAGTFSVPDGDYLYDSTQYNQGKSIFLQADSDCTYSVLHTEDDTWIRRLLRYREQIRLRITALGGKAGGGLAAAMLLGDRSGLSDDVKRAFSHAGLGPVLAVSGFHLVLFTGVCGIIGRKTRLQRMLQFFLSLLLTAVFVVISEWPISVCRAGVMLLLSRSACFFFRKADPLNSLCIAMILLTLPNPYLIGDASFLLSVSGTFGIGVFAPYMTASLHPRHWYGTLGKMLLSMCCVSLCTLPASVYFFSETSLLAPIANVIFTPACMILIGCAGGIFFLGALPVIPTLLGAVMDAVGNLLLDCLFWLEGAVPVSIPLGWKTLQTIAMILLSVIFVSFLLVQRRRMLFLSISMSLMIFSCGQYLHTEFWKEKLRICVLGRNAQQVLVICYGGCTDVIDLTGDRKNASYVQKFLTEQGISNIRMLYLTGDSTAKATIYDKALSTVSIEKVAAGTESVLRKADTVCGQTVALSDVCRIETEQYQLQTEDGKLWLEAYGKKILAGQYDAVISDAAAYDYVIAGDPERKQQLVLEMNSATTGLLLCAGQNLELVLEPDGTLYGEGLA